MTPEGGVSMIDLRSGAPLWQSGTESRVGGADDQCVYLPIASNRIDALDSGSGELKWRFLIETADFAMYSEGQMFSSSNAVHLWLRGVHNPVGGFLSLDKNTGSQLWVSGLDIVHVTPTAIVGVEQVSGTYLIRFWGLDATTGNGLWTVPSAGYRSYGSSGDANPIVIDDTIIMRQADESQPLSMQPITKNLHALRISTGQIYWTAEFSQVLWMYEYKPNDVSLYVLAEVSTPLPITPTAASSMTLPIATFTANVNVRNGPSTEALAIGSFAAGQTTEILAVSPDGGWYKVDYYNQEGWVFAHFVTVSGDIATLPQGSGNEPSAPEPTQTSASTLTHVLVAINPSTGEIRWSTPAELSIGIGSPDTQWEFLGEWGQFVLLSSRNFGLTRAYDKLTFELVWENGQLVIQPDRIIGVSGNTLIFRSDNAHMGIDMNSGEKRWEQPYDVNNYFGIQPVVMFDKLFYSMGNKIHLIDPANGETSNTVLDSDPYAAIGFENQLLVASKIDKLFVDGMAQARLMSFSL